MSGQSWVKRIGEDLVAFGLVFDDAGDPAVLAFETGGAVGSWSCFVWVREAESQVVVHGVLPWPVPPGRREQVALYLTRVNFGLIVGNFELDLDDGEVRFKTAIDFEGTEVDLELVRRLVSANIRTFDHYAPGIVEVVDGAAPDTAVADIEGATGR